MKTSLAFFFDGTNNFSDDGSLTGEAFSEQQSGGTNVWKFKCLVSDKKHECHYVGGVGNQQENNPLERIFGLIGGAGVNGYAKQQFEIFKKRIKNTQVNNTVHIIAFSRGAASAIQFAHKIATWNETQPADKKVSVGFMGLMDTVFTTGNPFDHTDMFLKQFLPPALPIACFRHAIATHEVRDTYAPIYQPKHENIASFEQKPFRGDHSDIGGGWKITGLSDRVLNWLIHEAAAYINYHDSNIDTLFANIQTHNPVPSQNAFAPKPRQLPHRAGGVFVVLGSYPRKFTATIWNAITAADKKIIQWYKITDMRGKGGPKGSRRPKRRQSHYYPQYSFIVDDDNNIIDEKEVPRTSKMRKAYKLTTEDIQKMSIIKNVKE